MLTKTQIGIFFALCACIAWGFVFAIPQLLDQLTPFEVSLSRYLFFGVVAVGNLIFRQRYLIKTIPLSLWIKAFLLALVSNFIHYTALVFGLRDASPPVATLILSLSPIMITLYGVWLTRKEMYRLPTIPLIAIAIGLVLVNVPFIEFDSSYMTFRYLFGLCCSLIALATWTWYLVANSRILSKYSKVAPGDWVTVIGSTTFVLVLFFGTIFFATSTNAFSALNSSYQAFYQVILGGLTLGIISSWCGTYFWNLAVQRLPLAFAGQLTLFETIFGLLFVFLINQRLPMFLESLGIIIMLLGVFFSYRQSLKKISFSLNS